MLFFSFKGEEIYMIETVANIYDDDGLKRKSFCKAICWVIENHINDNKGVILSINGKYGNGKTTALGYIKGELNQAETKYIVIDFDAWKNNLFDDPLLPMISALTESLKKHLDKGENTRKIIKEIFSYGIKIAKGFVESKMGFSLPEKESTIFDNISDYYNAINSLKILIKKTMDETGKRIIFLIDELDRCLPLFTTKLFERLHHIFDISGIALIVAMDRKQLEKTIETIFGENMDIHGYLARFFDFEFELPLGDEKKFLISKMHKCEHQFASTNNMLKIFEIFSLGLREKLKILSYFSLCFDYPIFPKVYPELITIILCLKQKHPYIYCKYFTQYKSSIYARTPKTIHETFVYSLFQELNKFGLKELADLKVINQETIWYSVFLATDNQSNFNQDEIKRFFNVSLLKEDDDFFEYAEMLETIIKGINETYP